MGQHSSDRVRLGAGIALLVLGMLTFLLPLVGSIFAPPLLAAAGFLLAAPLRRGLWGGAALLLMVVGLSTAFAMFGPASSGDEASAVIGASDAWLIAVWLTAILLGPYLVGLGVSTLVARSHPGTSGTATPPGWYADPQDAGTSRYWNGRTWTAHVAAASPQGAVATGDGHGEQAHRADAVS